MFSIAVSSGVYQVFIAIQPLNYTTTILVVVVVDTTDVVVSGAPPGETSEERSEDPEEYTIQAKSGV